VIKLKGDTAEQKFAHLEVVLNRMSRKLHKTVIGIVPPVPVMFSIDVPKDDGEIFSFLAPALGMITNICLMVGEYEGNEPVVFEASVKGKISGASAKFSTRKTLNIQEVQLPINPGDLLVLRTESPEKVRKIWLSFLYQMGVESATHLPYLIDKFTEIMEGESDAISKG